MEDLFVDPEYRGKGVGKAFFAELAKIAQEKARIGATSCVLSCPNRSSCRIARGWIGPFSKSVMATFLPVHSLINLSPQWNQPSIDFYEKTLHATAMSEWMGMRLEESGIENLKKFAQPS